MNQLIAVPRVVNKIGDWYQPPLGIAYVSASLKKAGFSLFTLNLNHIHGSIYDILKNVIYEYKIDIVLTGGLTGQYGSIRDIIGNSKLITQSVITIVGGGIITSAPEHAMEALEFADYGVIGEGEIISCELCQALENGRDIKQVPGVVYKDNNSYKQTKGEVTPINVEEIPFPDYSGLEIGKLLDSIPNTLGMCEYNTLPIITSRGCPFKCTFCFHPSGQKFRQRSLDSVFAEINYLVKEYGVKFLSIEDELFGRNMKRIEEFCNRIKSYKIKWFANFRVPDITPELVHLLKESNCAVVGFGIESADNEILKSIKKKITIEQTEKALKLVYNAGMGIQGVFIFGDVAETIETATKTINWWKEHINYEIQLSAIITYPGTALYKYARLEGLINDPVQYIRDACPLVKLSKKMSDEDYSWLFGQILSLPRLTHKTPNEIQITQIDYENASIDITGNCVSCNSPNKWKKVKLFILETLACNNCGKRHIAPVPENIVNKVRKNINELLNKYGKIAFWGINSYFYTFSEKLNLDLNRNIFYIDKSEVRQGVEVSGHVIHSPEILSDEEIKCVVVSVVQYFAGLKKPIEDEYPQVEKVLSISELLSDDLLIRL
ncbi:hypothetical protein BuS5_03055 [Desulfosarcina sp. BuS5]|uniref:B12-binding domain-containing radical SAM protein n=1 Tax=Desulfosarcina sp. BuS5 TaxID=933262 RepID=UPI0004808B21|nr:radical SAM protein [Desulfosarcina sp. BuS5]WDN90085.1 hypothetical protein BuS5_03055 [Desulfosarcina sp. BuS5]